MKKFGALISVLAFIGGILLWDHLYRFLYPPPAADPRQIVVRIHPGTGLRDVALQLQRQGIISSPFSFVLLAYLKGYNKKIQWGDFELYPGIPGGELLSVLASGKTVLKRVTIPEGFNLRQIAHRLAEENLVEVESFLAAAHDP